MVGAARDEAGLEDLLRSQMQREVSRQGWNYLMVGADGFLKLGHMKDRMNLGVSR